MPDSTTQNPPPPPPDPNKTAPTRESAERNDAVTDVANGDGSTETRSKALAWFMSPQVEQVAKKSFEINVGGEKSDKDRPPNWIPITVQVVDRDRIDQLRRESTITARDGTQEVDAMESNAKLVVEGMIDPPVKQMREVAGQTFLDPADALRARFAFKPGLIDQIAGEITKVSGYDTGDIREIKAGKP